VILLFQGVLKNSRKVFDFFSHISINITVIRQLADEGHLIIVRRA